VYQKIQVTAALPWVNGSAFRIAFKLDPDGERMGEDQCCMEFGMGSFEFQITLIE
jgi:hypothetical protein